MKLPQPRRIHIRSIVQIISLRLQCYTADDAVQIVGHTGYNFYVLNAYPAKNLEKRRIGLAP